MIPQKLTIQWFWYIGTNQGKMVVISFTVLLTQLRYLGTTMFDYDEIFVVPRCYVTSVYIYTMLPLMLLLVNPKGLTRGLGILAMSGLQN